MTTTTKRKPGRPPAPDGKKVQVNVRMTSKQRETFYKIGGAEWLRNALSHAALKTNDADF